MTVYYAAHDADASSAGTSEDPFNFADAIANSGDGDLVWFKEGTYPISSDVALSVAGTSTNGGRVLAGYSSTPGDLDGVFNSANRPVFSMSSARVNVSGAFHELRNIDISGTYSDGLVSVAAHGFELVNCSVANSGAGTSTKAISATGAYHGLLLLGCKFTNSNVTDDNSRVAYLSVAGLVIGCSFVGGRDGLRIDSSAHRSLVVDSCLMIDNARYGLSIQSPTRPRHIRNCTIYSPGSDGVILASPSSDGFVDIVNTLVHSAGGYSYNMSAGEDRFVRLINCADYNPTTASTNGISASRILGLISESSDPLVNAAGNDFGLVSGADSVGGGFPQDFEGYSSLVGYPDVGAVRRTSAQVAKMFRAASLRGGFQS